MTRHKYVPNSKATAIIIGLSVLLAPVSGGASLVQGLGTLAIGAYIDKYNEEQAKKKDKA